MLVWLSFADPNKQPGKQFLGVCVIPLSNSFIDSPKEALWEAKQKAWELGINPGGEIRAAGMPDDAIPKEFQNKLLSRDDLEANGLGQSTRK